MRHGVFIGDMLGLYWDKGKENGNFSCTIGYIYWVR